MQRETPVVQFDRLIGQAGRTSALKAIIDHMAAKDKVWFARRIDIANWWHDNHASFER